MNYIYEDIELRTAAHEDLDFIFSSEHAPGNVEYVVPCTMECHEEWMRSSDITYLVAERTSDRAQIAFVILAGLEDPDDCLEFRRLIVVEKNRGYGRKVLRLAKKFAFEECKAHRLWLDVKDYNDRAIHLYESEGFVIEGRHRECLKTGNIYETLYVMAILVQDYEASKHGG